MAQTVNMDGRTNTYGAEYRYWDFYMKCMWYCWNLIKANALTFWLSCQDRAHSSRSSRVSGLTTVYTSELQRGWGQTKNCSTLSKKGPHPRQLERRTLAAGKALTISTGMLKLLTLERRELLTLKAPLTSIPNVLSCSVHPLGSSRAWTLSLLTKPPVNTAFWCHGAFVGDF